MKHMQQLSELSMKNHKLMVSIISNEFSKYGITAPQAFVLGELKDGPRTIGDISKALDLSYSTISGIVDRLERNRIVTRRRDETDRRIVKVCLTKDEHVLKDCPILEEGALTMFFASIFEGISKEELEILEESAKIFYRYLSMKQKRFESVEKE